MREPYAAGKFYTDNKEELINQLRELFHRAESMLKNKNNNASKATGIISPHAGYFFSGLAAAEAYNYLKNSHYDSFVILGVDHTGLAYNDYAVSIEDWKTPLGIVRADLELANRITKNANIAQNNDAHKFEHSIEVQLPFLQMIFKEPRIVAITAGRYDNLINKQIAQAIKEEAEKGKSICVIASSDFTHYGYDYGFVPFENNDSKALRKSIMALDFGAIQYIKNLDSQGFLGYVEKTGATICGVYTIAAIIDIINELEEKKDKISVEVVDYYTSADILKDNSNSVSYAAILFNKNKTISQKDNKTTKDNQNN